jgi:hypothetical protein
VLRFPVHAWCADRIQNRFLDRGRLRVLPFSNCARRPQAKIRKVADLVETGSPLDIGLRGVYQGVPFELTGRAQLGHQAGGIWDEWYAAFQDGRWGWLPRPRAALSHLRTISARQSLIPPFATLYPGGPVAALSSQCRLRSRSRV